MRSDEASPLLHVELDPSLGLSVAVQKKALRAASRKCVDAGYAIGTFTMRCVVCYWSGLEGGGDGHEGMVLTHTQHNTISTVTSKYKIGEGFEPAPSLRVAVSAIHTPEEIKGALDALKSAVAAALKK